MATGRIKFRDRFACARKFCVVIYPALLAGYYIVYTYREPIDFAGSTVHCLLVQTIRVRASISLKARSVRLLGC